MSDIRVSTIFHKKDCYNPLSGHRWTEDTTFSHYEVSGGFFATTRHKTLKSAEKEQEGRVAFNARHPFTPPQSEREIAKAKKLGL